MSDSIDRRTWKPVDHDSAVSLIGEGVHKGIRKVSEDPTGLWRAIFDGGETWGEGVGYCVYMLEYMGMALCEKTEVDPAPRENEHQCPAEENGWKCVLYRGHDGDHATEGSVPYDEVRAEAEKAAYAVCVRALHPRC